MDYVFSEFDVDGNVAVLPPNTITGYLALKLYSPTVSKTAIEDASKLSQHDDADLSIE